MREGTRAIIPHTLSNDGWLRLVTKIGEPIEDFGREPDGQGDATKDANHHEVNRQLLVRTSTSERERGHEVADASADRLTKLRDAASENLDNLGYDFSTRHLSVFPFSKSSYSSSW